MLGSLPSGVDGVLTDGRVWFDEEGREMHAFHVKDGMGMVLAKQRGLKLALRMDEIHLGIMDKAVVLREVLDAIFAARG